MVGKRQITAEGGWCVEMKEESQKPERETFQGR